MKNLFIGLILGVLLIIAVASDFVTQSLTVNGVATATSFSGSGSGLTAGTVPNQALVTQPLTNWITVVPYLLQLSISNNATTAGLGATNTFEVRNTNSAAIAADLSVSTNHFVYVWTNLIVGGSNVALSFTGSGIGLSSGTIPNAALVTQPHTNWNTVAPYLFQLGVSNNATTVGLGATNYFEARDTNSAAVPPDFSVGTNHSIYAKSATIGTNYTFVAWLATNALSSWPTAPKNNGDAALVSSNGTVYLLTSTNAAAGSATWTWTNRVGPQ
jgi:hypothetical protein